MQFRESERLRLQLVHAVTFKVVNSPVNLLDAFAVFTNEDGGCI